jgi:hypothetical protein
MRVVMAAVCVVCFVAACGGDDGENGRDGQDGTVLTSMDLPIGSQQCPAGGILVTVDGTPTALCNGAQGADGRMGAEGAAGAPGKDGEASGYRPVLIMSCGVALDVYTGSDGIDETYLGYDAVVYSNGDAEVSCESALGGAQSGTSGSYFPAVAVGAADLGCSASVDYPPSDGVAGFMAFQVGPQGPSAVYTDAPHAMDGDYYTFGAADCVVRKWSGSAWVNGSLADI